MKTTEAITEKTAWVIELDEFESVAYRSLTWCADYKGCGYWESVDRMFTDENIFTTELAARNELEKRLYNRSEALRKHREEMSRALVNCSEVMP